MLALSPPSLSMRGWTTTSMSSKWNMPLYDTAVCLCLFACGLLVFFLGFFFVCCRPHVGLDFVSVLAFTESIRWSALLPFLLIMLLRNESVTV